MKPILKKITIIISTLLLSSSLHAANQQCTDKDFSLQLLGSGGPISDDQRSSSGNIIWWQGKSAILIDVGGGVFLRFGQSGARLEDLQLIALSHFHTDHSADLPALLKGAYFFNRPHKIVLSGPTAGGVFPSTTEFFSRMFDSQHGAYAYLSGLYNGTDGLKLSVDVKDINYHLSTPITVFDQDGLKVTALGIPHGDVPCLAYRIDTSEGSIVVSADQNGSREEFINFAKGADLLVMPLAITENTDATSKFMHATPATVGKIAKEINPKVLVLNHFMGKELRMKDETVNIVKQYYHGDIYAGRDLSCLPINVVKDAAIEEVSK